MEKVSTGLGAQDTGGADERFFALMAEIQHSRATRSARFIAECDALAAAAGISQRDARYANLFPELFHCSGVAFRGTATRGGRVLHARVLDYMCDLGLQEEATVTLFMPRATMRGSAWVTPALLAR